MTILRKLVPAALLVLAACSAEGQHKVLDQAAALQPSYDSVKVLIVPQAKDSTEVVPDVRGAVVGQLFSSGRFRRVTADSEPADLVVTVKITAYAHVETVERVLVGIFAGRNRITAEVSVTDGKSGSLVRRYEAVGESAAHPMSAESGFGDALRVFSKEVIVGLTAV